MAEDMKDASGAVAVRLPGDSAGIDQLAKALATFQMHLPDVVKDVAAKIETKSGASYGYKYADLADVSKAVLPLLGECDLAWICTLNGGTLTAMLVHGSGQLVTSTWTIPATVFDGDKADPKAVGSWLTYGRRYLLMTMTGVHPAGEDDDGDAAVRRRHDDAERPKPVVVTPLASAIAKGREAGLSDGSIKADLDELAGDSADHRQISEAALRQLWLQYQAMIKQNAAATAQAEADQAAGDAAQAAAESPDASTVDGHSGRSGAADPVAAERVVPDEERAAGQLQTAEALASWGDADPDDPVVEESTGSAAEATEAATTKAAAEKQLTDQLASRRAKR